MKTNMKTKSLTLLDVIADLKAEIEHCNVGDIVSQGILVNFDGTETASVEEVQRATSLCAEGGGITAHGVINDEGNWVCITGNGPKSEAHARLISKVLRWLPQMLRDMERQAQGKEAEPAT